jgi:hypothetical protein
MTVRHFPVKGGQRGGGHREEFVLDDITRLHQALHLVINMFRNCRTAGLVDVIGRAPGSLIEGILLSANCLELAHGSVPFNRQWSLNCGCRGKRTDSDGRRGRSASGDERPAIGVRDG